MDKKFQCLSKIVTGETQLRARRTRIKILRAIAERNGAAGFSDIKDATGLSTGSIYYHLERMGNYVSKDSKQYTITEEGRQLLREIDSGKSVAIKTEESHRDSEETVRQTSEVTSGSHHSYGLFTMLAAGGITVFIVASWLAGWHLSFLPSAGNIIANAGVVSSFLIAALLSVSFLFMIRRRVINIGYYRGTLLSAATVASVLIVNILIFSDLGTYFGAFADHPYDNSMDALLSSYSFHWGLR